jgi:hypothetical protein
MDECSRLLHASLVVLALYHALKKLIKLRGFACL